MRTPDLPAYYRIYRRLLLNSHQAEVADILKLKPSNVSRIVKYLKTHKILIEKVNSVIKIYIPGPGAKAFEEKVHRGGIPLIELPPGRDNLSQPTLEYYRGKACRTHNIQLLSTLKRPAPSEGLYFFTQEPKLPSCFEWVKTWKTNGGTIHHLGTIKLDDWQKPAKIHYTKGKMNKESLTIILPPTFTPIEWLEDEERLKDYFKSISKSLVEPFRKSGWIITEPKLAGDITGNRGIEYEFYHSFVAECNIPPQALTETLHIDRSGPGNVLKGETNNAPEAVAITKGYELIKKLPDLLERQDLLEKRQSEVEKVLGPYKSPNTFEGEGYN